VFSAAERECDVRIIGAKEGLTRLLGAIRGGGRRSVMYCKEGGRNAEPHIGVEVQRVEVQICEGRSGIPPLGL
jgi:hypothetical protein